MILYHPRLLLAHPWLVGFVYIHKTPVVRKIKQQKNIESGLQILQPKQGIRTKQSWRIIPPKTVIQQPPQKKSAELRFR